MENSSAKQPLTIISISFTDKGLKRHNNEDFVIGFEPQEQEEFDRNGSLYIVADGVGGARKGERASEYAAKKILYDYYQPTNLSPKERLSPIIQNASKEIYEYTTNNDLPRMASTLVAAVVRHEKLIIANVGDSRAYLIRKGSVTQITRDHNLAEELIRNGSMSPEEAEHSKAKNTLLRSLGGESEVEVDLFGEFDLIEGDLILLCTDGLSRYVTPEQIAGMSGTGSIEQIGQRMVDYANDSGGVDNISLYLIKAQREKEKILIHKPSRKLKPVTWDELQTQPAILSKKGENRFDISEISFRVLSKILWVLIGIAMISGIVFLFMQHKQTPPSSTLNLKITPTLIKTTPTISTLSSASIADQDRLPTQESPESVTVAPFVLSEDTATSEPTPTAETPTPAKSRNVCVYKVVSGDNATTVYAKFGFSFQDIILKEYFRCSLENNTCPGPSIEIENPDLLNPDQILEIPSVTTQESCTSIKNAYWVTIN